MRQDLLSVEALRAHSDTSHSVGLLWMNDQPDVETSAWEHTTFKRDRHSCPQRDSKPQFQQADPRLRRAATGIGTHVLVRWNSSFRWVNCSWGERCGEVAFTWQWKEAVLLFGEELTAVNRDMNKLCSTFRFILCKFEIIHNNLHRKNGLHHVDVEIIYVSGMCKASVSVYCVYEGHIIQPPAVVLVRWQNVTRFNQFISF